MEEDAVGVRHRGPPPTDAPNDVAPAEEVLGPPERLRGDVADAEAGEPQHGVDGDVAKP
eukprot:SAG11_NODE_10131_length_852_cov_2.264276_2_plen_58_part_01